jgi:hypothetical protein
MLSTTMPMPVPVPMPMPNTTDRELVETCVNLSSIAKASKRKYRDAATTVSFADICENGPGMERIGMEAERTITVADLHGLEGQYEAAGGKTSFYPLLAQDSSVGCGAAVLVMHNFADVILGVDAANILEYEIEFMNQKGKLDGKALFRGTVKNKLARHNNVIADFDQEPVYEKGKGTVVRFCDYPMHEKMRAVLCEWLGLPTLNAEVNYYYDVRKCGIGFHGDSERTVVAGLRLGTATAQMPLLFQAYYKLKPYGEMTQVALRHGDVYVMCGKAVGNDWKKRSLVTLRHAAGSQTCAYSKLKKQKSEQVTGE